MKHPDMKPPRRKRIRAAEPSATSSAFDLWLQRGLHQMYDDVANEPIPEHILKLIADDPEK